MLDAVAAVAQVDKGQAPLLEGSKREGCWTQVVSECVGVIVVAPKSDYAYYYYYIPTTTIYTIV